MFLLRFTFVIVFSLSALPLLWSFSSDPIQVGATIEEVLRQYQVRGMKILYSSRLVNSEMIVRSEPRSGSPVSMLDQVLGAHGLKISRGPAGTLLVVRDRERVSKKKTDREVPQIEEQMNVPFVTIYITAKDSSNSYLTNLRADDFILKEDGVEQEITEFTNFADADEFPEDSEPLSMMMLIDSSASMNDVHLGQRKYDLVINAATRLTHQVRPQDQIMIMGFNQSSWDMSELTADKDLIRERLNSPAELIGRTALYDVLVTALQRMDKFPGRRVLVICSDGQDSASKINLDDLLKFLRSTDVTIFVLGTDDKRDVTHAGRDVLKKISEATSGYFFHSSSESDLHSAIDKVRMTLRSQYAAGYVPPHPMIHKWRRVKIECKIPGVRLRYRGEYLY
jgi:Ca-activated chloride channel family protein